MPLKAVEPGLGLGASAGSRTKRAPRDLAGAPERARRIGVCFEPGLGNAVWATMGSHHFSLALLREMRDLFDDMASSGVAWRAGGALHSVNYVVLRSSHPRFFSLGGDLGYFHDCIVRRDEASLRAYSTLCMKMLHEWATVFNNRATTLALVQGRALGGGFEAALSADFLIAEEHSEFGFPEITFGLFPCTGGMNLLARRVGASRAERMMTSGKLYTARELHEMGVVDEICGRGEGERATRAFIERHGVHRAARMAIQRARHRVAPLDYEALSAGVDDWVALAMRLEDKDLRAMDMLARMQHGSALLG